MNIVITNSHWEKWSNDIIFQDEPIVFIDTYTLEDLAVKIGAYQSKSKARQAGKNGAIPSGYSHGLKLSKKYTIFIYNPSETLKECDTRYGGPLT